MSLLNQYSWRNLVPLQVHPDYTGQVWDDVLRQRPATRTLQRWADACEVELNHQVVALADWIVNSKSTVVLSGAGLSVASGVPDFRSPSGWWKNVDPTTVATVDALHQNYDLFDEFYSHRIYGLEGLGPNVGHQILAKWEEQGLVSAIATQNVDGFHQMAGSRNVYELHGSIRSFRCVDCGKPAEQADFLDGIGCQDCGGHLRPNVTLFDELLPEKAWDEALAAIGQSDLVIVLGSSLTVYPVNTLPAMTSGKAAVVNFESTRAEDNFDLVIHGKLEEVLPEVDRWVQGLLNDVG